MIFLDSADLKDAAAAAELSFVSGITTNPTLMAKQEAPPLDQLRDLLRIFPNGQIFYQPGTSEMPLAEDEARRAWEVDPARVVLKLPARWNLYTLASRLTREGVPCAITAVYSPGQAILAHQVGCRWIIPYVDRARRLMERGEDLVPSLATVLRALGSSTQILAASLKSPEQITTAVGEGAHAVTLPMSVLAQLARHPLTESAITEFEQAVGKHSGEYEVGGSAI